MRATHTLSMHTRLLDITYHFRIIRPALSQKLKMAERKVDRKNEI
jgi:hypothetical protein